MIYVVLNFTYLACLHYDHDVHNGRARVHDCDHGVHDCAHGYHGHHGHGDCDRVNCYHVSAHVWTQIYQPNLPQVLQQKQPKEEILYLLITIHNVHQQAIKSGPDCSKVG